MLSTQKINFLDININMQGKGSTSQFLNKISTKKSSTEFQSEFILFGCCALCTSTFMCYSTKLAANFMINNPVDCSYPNAFKIKPACQSTVDATTISIEFDYHLNL